MSKFHIPVNEVTITRHARERIAERGFALNALLAVLANPATVYEAHKPEYRGQWRVQGDGMSIVYDSAKKVVITVFFDGKLDPNHKGGK